MQAGRTQDIDAHRSEWHAAVGAGDEHLLRPHNLIDRCHVERLAKNNAHAVATLLCLVFGD